MAAIFKREFKAYFTSPIGYCVLAILFGLTGFFFVAYNVTYYTPDLTPMFQELQTYMMILVLPILTMRLMSDDKRQKTDQILLTSPVSLTGIVTGKYLAAMLLFAIGCSMTLVCAVIVAFQTTPDWLVIFGNYIGLLLNGGLVIAIGLLISSLTESQFIAALGSFIASLMLLLLDNLKTIFNSSLVNTVVDFLSVNQRYASFAAGVIQYDDIIYFLSWQALFLFLTVRLLDRKRWN
jgi:ABC-2 type transport system permease protein